jgi:O-antigen/teichoic acid export membrane protein
MENNDLQKEFQNPSARDRQISLDGKEENKFLQTEHLKIDLKAQSIKGGAVTLTSQIAKFLLQTVSTVILARLLTPADYGLIAMVAVVINFIMMFKDMGLSMATVQKSEINHAQISTLFWINIAISLLIMMILAGLAPLVSWFYTKPQLTLVTLALASTFIFSGLTIQHRALLIRQMRFGRIALVEISAMLISVIAAVISAYCGAGYWALVIMQVVLAITNAIGVWIVCPWRPGLPERHTNIGSMLFFGGNLTGFNLINYFARNADNILIGKFIGSTSLGFYSRAYSLLMLPIQQINAPISSVAIPALSRLQGQPEKFKNYYLQAINLIAFITMPLVLLMAALSNQIILIFLGPNWLPAALIFKVLAFSAVIQPILNTTGWIYISLNQTDRLVRWGMISCPVIILSFLIGLPWGTLGVAVSYTICMCLIIPVPCLFFAFRFSPIKISDCLTAIAKPFIMSIIIYTVVQLVCHYYCSVNPFLTFLYGLLAAFAVIIFSILLWPNLKSDLLDLLKIVQTLKRKT